VNIQLATLTNELPLLLQNLKKAFSEKVQGPIKGNDREYQLISKSQHLHQLVKFLSVRGVRKLAAINAWKDETAIKLAYHFITKIGTEGLDSKITIIIISDLAVQELESIQDLFPNAKIFEKELSARFNLKFQATN